MALDTLKGCTEIGGFSVVVMDELREKFPDKFNESGAMDYQWFEKDIRPKNFVYLRHDKNSLSFTLQNGPIKEVGVNGCQIDTLIAAAHKILVGLNAKFPCPHNLIAVKGLENAMLALDLRTAERQNRGVEGANQA